MASSWTVTAFLKLLHTKHRMRGNVTCETVLYFRIYPSNPSKFNERYIYEYIFRLNMAIYIFKHVFFDVEHW